MKKVELKVHVQAHIMYPVHVSWYKSKYFFSADISDARQKCIRAQTTSQISDDDAVTEKRYRQPIKVYEGNGSSWMEACSSQSTESDIDEPLINTPAHERDRPNIFETHSSSTTGSPFQIPRNSTGQFRRSLSVNSSDKGTPIRRNDKNDSSEKFNQLLTIQADILKSMEEMKNSINCLRETMQRNQADTTTDYYFEPLATVEQYNEWRENLTDEEQNHLVSNCVVNRFGFISQLCNISNLLMCLSVFS